MSGHRHDATPAPRKPTVARASRPAPARVRPSERAGHAALASLQRRAGNAALGTLFAVQRAGSATPGSRPTLRQGSTGEAVGVLQQKLNAAGATPPLLIDGQFGSVTKAAVKTFQGGAGLFGDGVAGRKTWAALDTGAPGGGRDGAGIESPLAHGTADPVGVPDAGTSLHPVVGLGNVTTGPAVEEAQQKLNHSFGSSRVAVDGTFDAADETVVKELQAGAGIAPRSGVIDAQTWTALDAAGRGGSTVGHVTRTWSEMVGGRQYGLTSTYTWRLEPAAGPTAMRVEVGMNFVPDPGVTVPVATWFGHIRTVWNRYSAVHTGTGQVIDFRFDPRQSGAAAQIKVHPGTGRANAGEFFVGDTDAANTIPHEFGHLVGLQDEYQLTAADYQRTTGTEAPVGATGPGVGNASAPAIARELHTAVHSSPNVAAPAKSVAVIQKHGLLQGMFAQQVASAYAKLASGTGIVDDIVATLPANTEFNVVQPFMYSSGSIMGDEGRMGALNPHDHGARPRHLTEFAGYLQEWGAENGLAGAWELYETPTAQAVGLAYKMRALMQSMGLPVGTP